MEVIITILPGDGLGSTYNLTSNVGTCTPSTATYDELIDGLVVTVDDSSYLVTVQSNGECTAELDIYIPDAKLYKVENVYRSTDYDDLCSMRSHRGKYKVDNLYSSVENDTLRDGVTYFLLTGIEFEGGSSYYSNGYSSYGKISAGIYTELGVCQPATTTTTTLDTRTELCNSSCSVSFENNLPGSENRYVVVVDLPEAAVGTQIFDVTFDTHYDYTNPNSGFDYYGIQVSVTVYDGYTSGSYATNYGLFQTFDEDWTPYNQKITTVYYTDQFKLVEC